MKTTEEPKASANLNRGKSQPQGQGKPELPQGMEQTAEGQIWKMASDKVKRESERERIERGAENLQNFNDSLAGQYKAERDQYKASAEALAEACKDVEAHSFKNDIPDPMGEEFYIVDAKSMDKLCAALAKWRAAQ